MASRWTRINSKILTFALLATLIPSIGLGVMSFWRHEQVISDNVSHELRSLATDANGELTMWLRERVNEVRTLSTAYVLVDGLAPPAMAQSERARIGPAEVQLYLRSVQKKLEPLLELTLSDAAGHVIASSRSNPPRVVLPTNWPNTAVTEGVIVAPPRWDEARATATLTLVVPVLSLHNELLGALSAVLDLGTIKPRLQNVAASSSAEIILLASDGKPLLATQTATPALMPLGAHSLNRLRAQPSEPMNVQGHHQRDVVAVADKHRAVPVIVVAERDRDEIFAAWLKLLELFVLLTGALTLMVGVVAYWMGRSIVTPLNSLIVAADGIAHGDLSVRLSGEPAGEIGHLTRVFNMMADRLRRSRAEVQATHQALQAQNQLLEALAATDSLTGLYNRKKLDDILAEQFARFRRNRRPFAVLMLDLDRFKAINDTHGHVAGDQVLVELAAILRQTIRSIDYASRYGGEEFVVVLVETPGQPALDVAERIRCAVEGHSTVAADGRIAVTVSLGVADSRAEDEGPEAALARADQALYEAKRAGRNRVQRAT
jgi:diguanylate cyclase (GGDEF)-like protein